MTISNSYSYPALKRIENGNAHSILDMQKEETVRKQISVNCNERRISKIRGRNLYLNNEKLPELTEKYSQFFKAKA
jgi:hypothetical protein